MPDACSPAFLQRSDRRWRKARDWVAGTGFSVLLACTAPPPADSIEAPHRTVRLEVPETPIAPGAPWTSPWLVAPFAFDELLPSWNVDPPEGSAFRVEVQVAGSEPASASPWLDLGGQGEWPEAERAGTSFDGGRVAVDIALLEAPRRRWRWRVAARGEPVLVRSVHACFTDRDRLATLDPGPEPLAVRVEVAPRHQQAEGPELGSRICSPTSVAAVLAYRGADHPTAEVAALLYDAENDLYGNWNRAVQGAWTLGVPGYLTRVSTWEEAARFIEGGTPLVISIGALAGQLTGAPYRKTAGHLLVLCGFDGEGRAIVMDPACPVGDDAPRRYYLSELETVWLRRGGFAYVLGER